MNSFSKFSIKWSFFNVPIKINKPSRNEVNWISHIWTIEFYYIRRNLLTSMHWALLLGIDWFEYFYLALETQHWKEPVSNRQCAVLHSEGFPCNKTLLSGCWTQHFNIWIVLNDVQCHACVCVCVMNLGQEI